MSSHSQPRRPESVWVSVCDKCGKVGIASLAKSECSGRCEFCVPPEGRRHAVRYVREVKS